MKVATLGIPFPLQHVKIEIEHVKLRTESRAPFECMIAALTYFSGVCGTKFSKK